MSGDAPIIEWMFAIVLVKVLKWALGILIFGSMLGMLVAINWVVIRLVSQRPLLPPWPKEPKIVPWSGLSVVLVLIVWLGVPTLLTSAYVATRPSLGMRVRAALHMSPTASLEAGPAKLQAKKRPHAVDGKTRTRLGPVSLVTGKEPPPLSFTETMLLVSVINGLLLVMIPALLRLASGARLADLGVTAERMGRNVVIGAVAFLATTPVVMLVNLAAVMLFKPNQHPVERMLREESSVGAVLLAYLSAVIFAPAAEELIFRGVIQAWLRKVINPPPESLENESLGHAGPDPAPSANIRWLPRLPQVVGTRVSPDSARRLLPVVVTSALFAAMHFEQMPAPFAIFVLSLVLGLLYERTGSLVASFVLHALFNGFNTSLLVFALLVSPQGANLPTVGGVGTARPEKRVEFLAFRLARGEWAGRFLGGPASAGRAGESEPGASAGAVIDSPF